MSAGVGAGAASGRRGLPRPPAGGAAALPTALLLIVAAAGVPALYGGDPYAMTVAVLVCFNVALAQSLNIVTGFAGAVSLCQAAVYGIGAYTAALLTTKAGVNPWVALVGALIVAGLAGTLLGLATVRIGGAYFAIATIGFQEIVSAVLVKWDTLTGGTAGVVGLPLPSLFGSLVRPGVGYYLVALAWAVAVIALLTRIRASRMGQELVAVREDEAAARAAGIRTTRLRVLCFASGSAVAGLTGGLYAYYQSTIDPTVFGLPLSAAILVMVILGGRASILGVTLGAAVLTVIPEYLRALQDYRLVVYGVVLILLVVFLPGGLAGGGDRVRSWLRDRRRTRTPRQARE